jgi:hypothetical protein
MTPALSQREREPTYAAVTAQANLIMLQQV